MPLEIFQVITNGVSLWAAAESTGNILVDRENK